MGTGIKEILVKFSAWLAQALLVLWTFRVITIALIAMYGVFWQMDQGQDLLVNLNDSHFGVIVFYAVTTITAALFWHLPKYFSKNTNANFPSIRLALGDLFRGAVSYKKEAPGDLKIARMLGVIVFLVPSFAVLNVLDKYGINVPGPYLLLALTSFAYVLLFQVNWIEVTYEHNRSSRIYFHFAILLCVAATACFGLLNHGRPRDLRWLCAGMCLLSAAFAIAVSIRRHLSAEGIAGWIRKQFASTWVMVSSAILAAVFIIMNFFPFAGTPLPFFTISAFLSGVIFHVLLFAFLLLWTRVTHINFAGAFVAMALIMAVVSTNPFHEIRQIQTKVAPAKLTDHLQGWLRKRSAEIATHSTVHPYPVFIVNAYGGGIRAAAWTSLVVQQLDSAVAEIDSTDTFQHHVVAYSGASGGTIGASVMCALRASNDSTTQGRLKKFYRKDFLSPVLIGLIGRDFFFSTFGSFFSWFGVKMDDRSVLQEQIWENQFEDCFQSTHYGHEFSSLYLEDSAYEVPILLANTTEIKKGLKGIAAPVVLDSLDFHGAVPLNKLLRRGNGFRFSTAAFMSARFPAISPAGKMDTANYFMDGGLKENSGAETARQLKAVVERIIQSVPRVNGLVKVYLLSLPNSAPYAPEIRRKQIVQLTAPLQALATNWEGNTRVADSLNRVLFKDALFSLRPTATLMNDEEGAYKAVLPLGWQMSSKALERLEMSLKERQAEIDRVLSVF